MFSLSMSEVNVLGEMSEENLNASLFLLVFIMSLLASDPLAMF